MPKEKSEGAVLWETPQLPAENLNEADRAAREASDPSDDDERDCSD